MDENMRAYDLLMLTHLYVVHAVTYTYIMYLLGYIEVCGHRYQDHLTLHRVIIHRPYSTPNKNQTKHMKHKHVNDISARLHVSIRKQKLASAWQIPAMCVIGRKATVGRKNK